MPLLARNMGIGECKEDAEELLLQNTETKKIRAIIRQLTVLF
jgi:hypothetical protein